MKEAKEAAVVASNTGQEARSWVGAHQGPGHAGLLRTGVDLGEKSAMACMRIYSFEDWFTHS
jgi:hypothetical protein